MSIYLKMKNLFYTLSIFAAITIFGCAKASAQDLLKLHQKDLGKIENYFNKIETIDADFLQTDASSSIAEGKFLLSRPGKMRIEYQQPNKLLIIVNGRVLSYVDVELEETSHLSTNSTPASFLTRKKFSFAAKDIELVNFEKDIRFFKVTIVKKNKKEAGTFTLIFARNPIEFVSMKVKNDLDETAEVTLKNTKFGSKIDSKLFVIKNKNLPQ
jgi:outer membrane lipoprotein carrier protein